jgi:hypothetical protein
MDAANNDRAIKVCFIGFPLGYAIAMINGRASPPLTDLAR